MYQNEHDEMLASIRAGRPINDGDWMAKSTLMAIMGRMATYTGKLITWEMAFNSKEDLTPPKYEFGPMPTPPSPGRVLRHLCSRIEPPEFFPKCAGST
jgi:hypothetical protein